MFGNINTKKVFATGVMSVMFLGNILAIANESITYPLGQISTLECRSIPRTELSSDCKITLPRIVGANYDAYVNNDNYTKIYTMLREGSYSSYDRNHDGSHQGTDIATAKGTPTLAVADGEIYDAGYQAGYGNNIKLKFKYNGVNYYAVYAHLDQILVKKGDKVKIGQKIGEIGNSGTAVGAMGGYHLHFEIDKETSGKLVYSFYGCNDRGMGKNEYSVLDQGQCRSELEARTADPIVFLEKAGATIQSSNSSSTSTKPSDTDTPDTNNGTDTVPVETTNPVDTEVIVQPTVEAGSKSIAVTKPNVALLSDDMKDFFANNEIFITSNIPSQTTAGKSNKISIVAMTKQNKEFNGILSEPIEIVSSQSDVKSSPSSIAMLLGKTDVNITVQNTGKKTLAISIAGQKLASLSFEVNSDASHSSADTSFEGKNFKCRYASNTERMQYFF